MKSAAGVLVAWGSGAGTHVECCSCRAWVAHAVCKREDGSPDVLRQVRPGGGDCGQVGRHFGGSGGSVFGIMLRHCEILEWL